MSDIAGTLNARHARYGEFRDVAAISQELKKIVKANPNWEKMTHLQREALEAILGKAARIVSGDPDYEDSWHDIAGYARLAENECTRKLNTGL